jgi:hypothetical protein
MKNQAFRVRLLPTIICTVKHCYCPGGAAVEYSELCLKDFKSGRNRYVSVKNFRNRSVPDEHQPELEPCGIIETNSRLFCLICVNQSADESAVS